MLVSLVSLSTLWAFAASVTLGDGLNLRNVKTVHDHYGYPAGALGSALQAERRLSLVYLGSHTPGDQAAMESARLDTDRQATLFRDQAADKGARDAAPGDARKLADRIVAHLGDLDGRRAAIDRGRTTQTQAFANFTDILGDLGTLQGALSTLNDADVSKDARNQVNFTRARELLSQEDAIMAGALAAGRMTATDHADFVRLVGAQRSLYHLSSPELRDADRAYYLRVTGTPEYARLRTLEDRFTAANRGFRPRPGDDVLWKTTADSNLTRLRGVELAMTAGAEKRAEPISDGIILRVALAGVVGLIAVVASVILAIWVARSVIRDLTGLRRAALDLAHERLPRVIRRLRRGEEVDLATEAPPLSFGTREIDEVGEAFNAARRTAIQGAIDEAALRRNVSEVFVNLARRSQALLHRQLALLDSMERRLTDPGDLEDLFRVDHMAARMRRHAEGLIILSGRAPGRGWRNPVKVIDVTRAAASEIEDFTRVTVAPMPESAIVGVAVADVVHLLAELIENATAFSPPHTTVQVTGQSVSHGFSLEIEDRGLSMNEESLAAANRRLAEPPEFDLSDTSRLGLFVVGRLAQRHGIKVTLRTSPFGGMTAIVLLPDELVVSGDQELGGAPLAAMTRRAQDALVPAGSFRDPYRNTRDAAALEAGPASGSASGSVLRLPLSPDSPSQQPPQGPPPEEPPPPQPPQGEPSYGESPYGESPYDPPRSPFDQPAAPYDAPTSPFDRPAAGYDQPPVSFDQPGSQYDEASPFDSPSLPYGSPRLSYDGGASPYGPTYDESELSYGGPASRYGGPPSPYDEPTSRHGGTVPPYDSSDLPSAPQNAPADPDPFPSSSPTRLNRRDGSEGKSGKSGKPHLPRRVRQANIAPQLREDQAPPPPADPASTRPERSPEDLRAMMSAIQTGTRRGREELQEDGEES
ncbi:nitrate- and nitrite sensing domain-containing protein [Actinomadura barringtoniae]|uniref:histidine kinase n=1 Tax=Actinomadura barringtoniae TaxID=1427535 RepID=A0A939P8Y5_9ACTN|nr:nitrate- and nitrite sensing domain-containing protein [Actinomadura barringtoniae]MBO2448151.1 nitrate- and nitrite sensing domain-containing protein [Actinomadura barringtoniae]